MLLSEFLLFAINISISSPFLFQTVSPLQSILYHSHISIFVDTSLLYVFRMYQKTQFGVLMLSTFHCHDSNVCCALLNPIKVQMKIK